MIASTPSANFGRHVFGAASMASGVITLLWHDSHSTPPLRYLIYAVAVALIFGGAALLIRRTAKTGASLLLAAYLVAVLQCLPGIIAQPLIYNSWGNFFEQFSLLSGAALVLAHSSPAWSQENVARLGRILLGLCSASFAFEQAFYLHPTAALVPKWIPPSQMFWAVATTIAFALAALALLLNHMAPLSARLLTLMLVAFGLLVWVPLVTSDRHSHTNWSEFAETFQIAGAVWILADLLAERQPDAVRPPSPSP